MRDERLFGCTHRIVGALQPRHDALNRGTQRVGQLFCGAEGRSLAYRIVQHLDLDFVFGLGFRNLGFGKRVRGNHVVAAAVAGVISARFFDNAHVHNEWQHRVAEGAATDVSECFFAAAPRADHRFGGGRRLRKLFFFLE